MSGSDFSVTIVGGGLVGSLAAVYFAQRGWQVSVYELRGDIRKVKHASGRSINLALSVRGISGLQGAGAAEAILPNLIPMKGRMIHVGSGKLSSQPYGVFGECINSVDRKLVNEVLLNQAEQYPNVKIMFGYDLRSVDFHKKTLEFLGPDGSLVIVQTDLIVGCDGAYSRVRQNLMKATRMNFSQEYIEHGYVELTMPAGDDGNYKMDPNHLHIWPRHSFMLIALPNLDKSFTVTLFMPWAKFESIKNENDLLAFFDETFPDAVSLIGRGFLASEYFRNPKGPLVSVKCKPYNYKGNVVILGDAAHAMVPFYGQGMNCGFEDCLVLDEILTKHIGKRGSEETKRPAPTALEAALTEYSATRHKDAVAICDLAMYNYVEMRSSVIKFSYLFRKKVEGFLHRFFPKTVIPLYTMVSFSRIPYSEAMERFHRQTWWFQTSINTVSWASAIGLKKIFGCKMSSALKRFITKHFGGIPTSFKDLEWIIRSRPDMPPIIVAAKEYREVSPGSQPDAVLPPNPKISKHYYYTRDQRRSYPSTVTYTQSDITKLAITGGTQAKLPAGSASSETLPASTETTGSAPTGFFPPVINNRYKWTPSMPHLKPSAVNPELCIRGMKHQKGSKPGNSTPESLAKQFEQIYAKEAAELITEGDKMYNETLRESKEALENIIAMEDQKITTFVEQKKKEFQDVHDSMTKNRVKLKSRLDRFQVSSFMCIANDQKSSAGLHGELARIHSTISKQRKSLEKDICVIRSAFKRDSATLAQNLIIEITEFRKRTKSFEKPEADYKRLKATADGKPSESGKPELDLRPKIKCS
ncbi:kynurenine 3-monooxygenase, mitochondrial precursor [Phlyctochytrium bullatum]|nr:kynurenine 3-monooxygenase, mitochondrial precursor [Phlyctochytrium bullatum]